MNEKLIREVQSVPGLQLVAVTKKHTKEEVDELARLGLRVFGENRVQEFLEKYDPAYEWHIIGHLQTNKVKYLMGKVSLIESVDSIKLAAEIEKQAAKAGLVQPILIELKISDDPNKTGCPLCEYPGLLDFVLQQPHLRLDGLMCIASHTDDENKVAEEFDQMKEFSRQLQQKVPGADILSMGMSQDWKLAAAHGSTQVRIGTALFEPQD
ncbi:YggS family pyridoxal phosphate-dependent enzyme [uncultured Faecalibaculum sp.]|uniref:YggS family pyridoxal phosphate-dependent enzyme n=1 Tax=uncultured Faecalibaculum sp. TaxID=1729681 RepID=UPI002606EBAF|nr:YggS family pyridoxal phosphate-dependent enzyme [uncultured Faecalibaculum sp.]